MLGADSAATAQDDDYELRRARTPVPEFVAEAVEVHLGGVYDQEVNRWAPRISLNGWKDVDGRGTPIYDWTAEPSPRLCSSLAALISVSDHPMPLPGVKPEDVKTQYHEQELGLDKCVASVIMPENMLWWKCDSAGRYIECLIREYENPSDRVDHDKSGNPIDTDAKGSMAEAWRRNYVRRYRYWTAKESVLISLGGDKIERTPHSFGRVPIVRLIDRRKHRTPTIGKSRYEAIAELHSPVLQP